MRDFDKEYVKIEISTILKCFMWTEAESLVHLAYRNILVYTLRDGNETFSDLIEIYIC